MDIIKKYGSEVKKQTDKDPVKARKMIELGLFAENFRTKYKPDTKLPKTYRMLNEIAVRSVRNSLGDAQHGAWTNIFAPVEILQCFGLHSMSLECLSSFISGFKCEDYYIDYAESLGIASTLCSYHRNFIGAVVSGVIPVPAYAVTTSTICDGNINTFRYLTQKYGIDCYMIDIPHKYSEDAVKYVVKQLEELIGIMETKFHKKLDMEELRQVIHRENESKRLYQEFMEDQKDRYYPNTMTINLYMLFATHLSIGTEEILKFFRLLREDVKSYPEFHGDKVLWVHLMPYFQETLQKYFNHSGQHHIQVYDFNLDYIEQMDEEHPLKALARKMICNIYNGDYERKAKWIASLAEHYQPDGIINFCHWGCKQTSGGVMLLKEEINKRNIPMLILDGDAVDRRNNQDGQIKTRVEAFLEILKEEKEEHKNDRLSV